MQCIVLVRDECMMSRELVYFCLIVHVPFYDIPFCYVLPYPVLFWSDLCCSVPLFFSIKPSEFFSIQVGPQYSYLIKQTDVFKTGFVDINQQTEFENDNIRKNTLCFVAGADINIKHINLGLRAGLDLQNNKGDGTSSTPRYKNVCFQGTFGYKFYKN